MLQYISAPVYKDIWNMVVLFDKSVSSCSLLWNGIKVTPPCSEKRFDIHEYISYPGKVNKYIRGKNFSVS